MKKLITDRFVSLIMYVFMLISFAVNGQDPVSDHYYANAIRLNPSLAGIEGPAKFNIGYRNQWPNSGSSYITYQASYDQYIERIGGGLGFSVMNDRQGGSALNAYNLDLMYSYHLKAGRKLSLSGGLQAGIGQRSFSPGQLIFGDMYDPVTGAINPSLTEDVAGYSRFYPDFSAGISAFYMNTYGGVAIHHLHEPQIDDFSIGQVDEHSLRLNRKYTFHAGVIIPIMEKRRYQYILSLMPNIVFMQQGRTQQLAYGLDMLYKNLLLGVWTRHDFLFSYGNLIFTTGYSSGNFRFRYSYNIRLSSPTVRLPNMSAHEFSLIFIYENLNIRKRQRTIKCPNF